MAHMCLLRLKVTFCSIASQYPCPAKTSYLMQAMNSLLFVQSQNASGLLQRRKGKEAWQS
jgi:hypothetical protein